MKNDGSNASSASISIDYGGRTQPSNEYYKIDLGDSVCKPSTPFKTYIGRIKPRGFDFLGYGITQNSKETVTVAWKTWANHLGKLHRLYEQGASRLRIAVYVKNWIRWVKSGVVINLDEVLKSCLASMGGEIFIHLRGHEGGQSLM